jgi:hypothetical protein
MLAQGRRVKVIRPVVGQLEKGEHLIIVRIYKDYLGRRTLQLRRVGSRKTLPRSYWATRFEVINKYEPYQKGETVVYAHPDRDTYNRSILRTYTKGDRFIIVGYEHGLVLVEQADTGVRTHVDVESLAPLNRRGLPDWF